MEDILLVDDERTVLDSLLSALDWAEYGFKHIHTAQSALEALEILEEHPIDLLISDIVMPGMSGLDMLKIVRSRWSSTRCVLLSAHSEFEFAREALRLGVENYLLKPIDVAELRETVYRTIKNIDYTTAISHDLYDRNILARWLFGRISTDELVERSHYAQLNVLQRRYRVMYIYTKGNAQKLLDALNACLQLGYYTHMLQLDDDSGYLLVGGRDVTDDAIHESIHELLPQWPGALIVCGTQATGNGEVVQSRTDAVYAADYARLAGMTGWVSSELVDQNQLSIRALSQMEDILHLEKPAAQIRQWIDDRLKQFDPEQYPGLYAQVCLALDRFVSNQNTPPTKKIEFPPYSGASSASRAGELLLHALLETSKTLHQGMKELSPLISRLVKYAAANMSGTVSIKQFAEQTKMNGNYVGRLFKDEMGMYFSDYVCMTRINKAKVLLETTDLSVGDIARQVGIYNVSYFTQCFKKQERISPMKYRQQLQKGN